MASAPFVWRDGVHVAGTALFCDARRARSLCFLSHGGRRPGGRHRQILCTDATLRLLSAFEPALPGEALLCPYGRPFSLGGLRLELFPSGHLPGAAQLLVLLPGGRRLVYAGEIGPRPGLLCAPPQLRAAEALVCHAPLAALGRPLPEREEALAGVSAALARAAEARAACVLLCAEVGPAQDLAMHLLAGGARRILAHPRIHRYAEVYSALGAPLSALASFSARHRLRPGEVLLWPLDRPLTPLLRSPSPPHLVLVSGAALSEEAARSYEQALPGGLRLGAALPFPDGLDLPGLCRYLREAEARRCYLTAGIGAETVRALAAIGVRAEPLGPPRQLELFAA